METRLNGVCVLYDQAFMHYCLHSKAHALFNDTISNVSSWAIFCSRVSIGRFGDILLSYPYLEVEYFIPSYVYKHKYKYKYFGWRILSSYSNHYQPHKQAACVLRK